jgi:hypothetical protein
VGTGERRGVGGAYEPGALPLHQGARDPRPHPTASQTPFPPFPVPPSGTQPALLSREVTVTPFMCTHFLV